MSVHSRITYTFTDKAPAFVTYSPLLIVKAFVTSASIDVEVSSISLAGRILTSFADRLDVGQRIKDDLTCLVVLTTSPDANIIKLPSVSASMPQLKGTITKLQGLDYKVPDFPENPQTNEERKVHACYAKILGSAMNLALHKSNSGCHAPAAVEAYTRKHPHSMDKWSMAPCSHTDYARGGDFFSSEQFITTAKAGDVRTEFVGRGGRIEVKKQLSLREGEVLDSMLMSCGKLRGSLERTLQDCKEIDVVWSLYVKAIMVRISHPIVSGHAVSVYYEDVFDEWGQLFEGLGVNPNNGISSVYDKIRSPPASQQEEIPHDTREVYSHRPEMAMIDSVKGITNLHIPSDVIVDALMPTMICNSGQMWGKDGKQKDTKAVMPESTYARTYREMINSCKTNDAFDPITMGSVSSVGLITQGAGEYSSHDKVFEMTADDIMRVVLADGSVLMRREAETGDIWRAHQTKDTPIRNWVRLAVTRARQPDTPAIFWLDPERAHDRGLRRKVELCLKDHDLTGLDINITGYNEAIRVNMERLIRGKNTISVTGNIPRDYLTDLFPIVEPGTSAKMLSIVPLIADGGMYKAGAGGSAPKHAQQLMEGSYLRWDSLGGFLVLIVSLEETGIKTGNAKAKPLGKASDEAIGRLLGNNKSPSCKVGDIDNCGSHFYSAMYRTQALIAQDKDAKLKVHSAPLAKALTEQEATIVAGLNAVQSKPAEIDGYYRSSPELTSKVMHPGATFNAATDSLARQRHAGEAETPGLRSGFLLIEAFSVPRRHP